MKTVVTLTIAMLTVVPVHSQRPPDWRTKLPDPGPNRIEVRFALGQKAVRCKHFQVTAKVGDRIIMSGRFTSGFKIPDALKQLPQNHSLELQFTCGRKRWHFSGVGERAFLPGRWWVGTDYPPFQPMFSGDEFKNASSIEYLIIRPTKESGFDVFRVIPGKQVSKVF